MKKTIRALSVVALILAGLCLLLLITCICMQKTLLPIFGAPDAVLEYFYVPVASIVSVVGILLAAFFLLLGINMDIVIMEILSPALVFVTPILSSLVSFWQTVFAGRYHGSAFMAGLASVSRICNFPMYAGSLASILVVLACGMSIVWKKMSK